MLGTPSSLYVGIRYVLFCPPRKVSQSHDMPDALEGHPNLQAQKIIKRVDLLEIRDPDAVVPSDTKLLHVKSFSEIKN